MLSTFEWSKHSYQFGLFSFQFSSSTHRCNHLCPHKTVQKTTIFFHKNIVFVEKVFDMYLLLGFSSLFSQNCHAFFEKLLLNCCTFEKLSGNILLDLFGATFVSPISKKAKLSKWPKILEDRTNMDIILLFLAKPLEKHGTTLVHMTYPPLNTAWNYQFRSPKSRDYLWFREKFCNIYPKYRVLFYLFTCCKYQWTILL